MGLGEYGGRDAPDPGLTRAAWCLARHQRPEIVVETAVARAMRAPVLLERDGAGSLGRAPHLDGLLAEDSTVPLRTWLRRR